MLRYPDVSATQIAFVYANDIWVAPREGGLASPLASPPGAEQFPRFSPDGKRLAFVGNYDGNRDLYIVSVEGGMPRRVTHHPQAEILCDWTPDGRLLYFGNGLADLQRQTQLLTVSADGGLPEHLPVPYGANGSISPDGEWLAYTPHTRDHRTWKRYRGGMATDVWLFNLKTHQSRKITDWEGTDSQPMWHGRTVYYLSDGGPEHRLNIWSFNVESGERKQVTKFEEFDCKWPSIGPGPDGGGEVVLQNGAKLYLVDLRNGESKSVEIRIPGDRPKIRPKRVNASDLIRSADVSATGRRICVEARGDIWTAPAKHGTPRNLTRTSAAAEREPSWSPDGKWIAYFSDASGEYELYVTQSDGNGETTRLTDEGDGYMFAPTWSPDSKHIAYHDKAGNIWLCTVESKQARRVDTDPGVSIGRLSWSHDSAWLAYTKSGDNFVSSVWMYDVATDARHQVTAGMFNDSWPTFDRKGDYLYLVSSREFSDPQYEDVGTTFIYGKTERLLMVPLRKDLKSPFIAKSDEESWEGKKDADKEESDDKDDKDDKNDKDKKDAETKASTQEGDDDADDDKDDDEKKDEKEPVKPLVLDREGFEQRAISLPLKRGNFRYLAVNHEGKLIYQRASPRRSDEKSAIHIFDPSDEKREEKTVLAEADGFAITADGKKLLVVKDRKYAIVDAAPDQKMEDLIDLSDLSVQIDPRAEWRQLFDEAWRVQRDYFYDPNMHGVDWNAMRKQYGRMVEDCVSREDVAFVIGELVSELNVGHAYVRGGGDMEDEPSVSVGLLGCDFKLENGAYRISRIVQGGAWDVDARGPLSQPGVDVKEGDYLLAVNHAPLDTAKDPWAALQGLAGKVVTLTVSDKPLIDDDARHVVVETLRNEGDLRYRAWVEKNRAYVAEKSGGKIGYVYVPNTGVNGQDELFRQFFGQVHTQALIVDERWNGGGQIPTRFIELLNRPIVNYWARRDGRDWPWPPDSHPGPKCMLINGLAGSGGDCFPYYFRQSGLGKLIGMRTWGGLVGISGNPQLIDGGSITVPTFAFYETDGTWGVEGHGVDPDIEVVDDPALMVDGGDPQLDAAIAHLQEELKTRQHKPPQRPAYPDRSGMGIAEQDK